MQTADRTDFKMIPETNALEQMQRELRFFPCENSSPQTLTCEQIAAFNRDGFVTGLKVFDAEEMVEHRRYFDDLLARVIAAGGDSYSISSAHLKYGRVHELLAHARIVRYVRDLLGPNVIGWGSHYFCKLPRDGQVVAWHQDASYWPLTPSKAVTVWLAVDDADRENACMKFLPGSHLDGHLAFRESESGEQNVLNQTVEGIEKYGDPVEVVLKAGEISIHTDLLLHGSEANNSDRRRCGLTLRYSPADVRAGMDWNQKGVYVSGSDPSGHWANRARPASD